MSNPHSLRFLGNQLPFNWAGLRAAKYEKDPSLVVIVSTEPCSTIDILTPPRQCSRNKWWVISRKTNKFVSDVILFLIIWFWDFWVFGERSCQSESWRSVALYKTLPYTVDRWELYLKWANAAIDTMTSSWERSVKHAKMSNLVNRLLWTVHPDYIEFNHPSYV